LQAGENPFLTHGQLFLFSIHSANFLQPISTKTKLQLKPISAVLCLGSETGEASQKRLLFNGNKPYRWDKEIIT